ncbi:hypothetical protein I4U23_018343 [Adineta vaga]|nr:hypothetical protein I4U23_018343 [Adineta vaga]
MNTTTSIDFDNNEQIRLLTNLREDIRILLSTHSKGIWYQMLPKVFYMHFHRDIHLDLFAIDNILLFLDYISDLIKYELPSNLNEEDFIIELNDERKVSLDRIGNVKFQRDILFKQLENVDFKKRGEILREISIIDEYEKFQKENFHTTHEHVALRFQKIRSMIDICLRHLLHSSSDISSDDLFQLYEQSNEFISNITPLTQHLSSLK